MSVVRSLLVFALAIAWLHALSVVPMLYDHSEWPEALSAVQPDLLALLLLAGLGASWRRPKLAAHLAAVVLLVSLATRLTIVVVRTNFQRDFELSDFLLFGGLYHALTNAMAAWQCWLAGAGVLLLVALLHWLTARAFRAASKPCQRLAPPTTRVLRLQLALLLVAAWLTAPLHRSVMLQLGSAASSAVQFWLNPQHVLDPIAQRIAAGEKRMAEVPCNLERLHPVDVHVIVLESYGRVMFRHPELRHSMQALFAELHEPLTKAGLQARTGACAPAITGGLSGLAHAELLTGVVVPDERTRDMLLASSLVCLPHRFLQAGYHTAEVQPAMPRAWPEGEAFYGIEESIWQEQLAYSGKSYAFGKMPDQYSLRYMLEHIVAPAKGPLFTMFIGVSGHAPWSSVPRFVPDWSAHADVYGKGPASTYEVTYTNMQRSPDAVVAYGDAIRYTVRTAVDYACRLTRPSLVIILGDHQPPIAAAVAPADTTHDVPIHVLSNQAHLLTRFEQLGFAPGMDLPDTVEAAPMADFAPNLLRVMSK